MKKMFAMVAMCVLCLGSMAHAQFAASGTTTLNLTVGPEAAIQVNTAATALSTSTAFANNYTGTTSFSYKVRTTKVGGTGTITALVTSDFSAGGGGNPSVANPPVAGDALTFTCATTGVGSACSSALTASTSSAQTVIGFGANIHSSAAGDSGSVAWSLPNDPVYPTGSYSATVTFTISAT